MRLPGFVCIGAMRCGTSTLWEMLSRHESIYLPKRKELHFFDDREGFYQRGVEAYAAHFEQARPEQIPGESTPCYMYYEEACERLWRTLPEARLVAILRDPVVRAWSHYWYEVRRGREYLSAEAAFRREPARLASGGYEARNRYSYLGRGRYHEQLRRFERRFSREQLCVVFFEELVADPEAVMARVFRHIGVAPTEAVAEERLASRNRGVHPRSVPLYYAIANLHKWAQASRRLDQRLLRRLYGTLRRLSLQPGVPALPESTRATLREAYRESDRELSLWLGRPLPWAQAAETERPESRARST